MLWEALCANDVALSNALYDAQKTEFIETYGAEFAAVVGWKERAAPIL